MDNCIRISGRDEGPFDVQRIEDGLLHSDIRRVGDFPNLCLCVLEMVDGRNCYYDVEYEGPNDHIFGKIQKNVIFYMVDSHNRDVEEKNRLEQLT